MAPGDATATEEQRRSSEMKQIRILGLAVLAVFALSVITATAAQATEGPFFKIENNRLLENEPIESAGTKEYVLKSGEFRIKCTGQKIENGTFEGSSGKTRSQSLEYVVFEGCTVTGNGSPCEVFSEKITGKPEVKVIRTKLLTNILDFSNKEATKGEKLLILFKPTKSAVFVTIKFTGTGCTLFKTETTAEGSVAAEALEEKEKPVTVEENEPEGVKGFVNFPEVPIKVEWEEVGGVRKEVKTKLTVFGKASELQGRSEVKLTSKAKWGVATK